MANQGTQGSQHLIDRCQRDREKLQQELAALEAVVAHRDAVAEAIGTDRTGQIARIKALIAQIDTILALAESKD
jgi:hypothetical protein